MWIFLIPLACLVLYLGGAAWMWWMVWKTKPGESEYLDCLEEDSEEDSSNATNDDLLLAAVVATMTSASCLGPPPGS